MYSGTGAKVHNFHSYAQKNVEDMVSSCSQLRADGVLIEYTLHNYALLYNISDMLENLKIAVVAQIYSLSIQKLHSRRPIRKRLTISTRRRYRASPLGRGIELLVPSNV